MPWECRIIVLVIFTAPLALVGQPWGGVSRPSNSAGDDFEVNRNRSSPTDSGVEDTVTPPEGPTTASLKDVGGLTEVIKELKELIAIPLKRPDLLAKLGLEPTRGVLLVPFQKSRDLPLCEAVARQLRENHQIVSLEDPRQLKGLFRGVEMVIGPITFQSICQLEVLVEERRDLVL